MNRSERLAALATRGFVGQDGRAYRLDPKTGHWQYRESDSPTANCGEPETQNDEYGDVSQMNRRTVVGAYDAAIENSSLTANERRDILVPPTLNDLNDIRFSVKHAAKEMRDGANDDDEDDEDDEEAMNEARRKENRKRLGVNRQHEDRLDDLFPLPVIL